MISQRRSSLYSDLVWAAFGNLLSRFAPSLASRLGRSGFDQAQGCLA